MKTLFLVCMAFLFSICSFAQSDTTGNKMNRNRNMNTLQHDRNNKNVKKSPTDQSRNNLQQDGLMMQNGKMMRTQNGKTTVMDKEMTLDNGTRIMSDGTVIKKDGTRMKMKNGEHMDMSGNMMRSGKNKNMYLVPDSSKNKNHY
jgi:hypothetical protein